MNDNSNDDDIRRFLRRSYENEKSVNWLFKSISGFEDPHNQHRIAFLLRQVREDSPTRVLDVGCGGGWLIRLLAKAKFSVIGFDLSFNVLTRIPRKNLENLDLVVGDAVSLSFRGDSFDMIICSEVLEHIPRRDLAIQEISRILTKNGRAIITVPNLWRYDALVGRYGTVSKAIAFLNFIIRKARKCPLNFECNGHLHKMFPWMWRRVLEQNGLIVIADYPIFISPYIPAQFMSLKIVERKMHKNKWFKTLQILLERHLGKIRPFKYFGQTHAFVARVSLQ